MDSIYNTIYELVLYLIYVLLLSGLVIWPAPPARTSRIILVFVFAVTIISAVYSLQSLMAEHQFSSLTEFFSWFGQTTEPVYAGKHNVRFIGSGWNGTVCLYIVAPVVVFALRALVRPRLEQGANRSDRSQSTRT